MRFKQLLKVRGELHGLDSRGRVWRLVVERVELRPSTGDLDYLNPARFETRRRWESV